VPRGYSTRGCLIMSKNKFRLGSNPLDWIKSTQTEETSKDTYHNKKSLKETGNKNKKNLTENLYLPTPVADKSTIDEMSEGVAPSKQNIEQKSNQYIQKEINRQINRNPNNNYDLIYTRDLWMEKGKDPNLFIQKIDQLEKENLIIFDTNEKVLQVLKKRLPKCKMSLVLPGKRFLEKKNNIYEIDPTSIEHYRELIILLKNRSMEPGNILLMWPKYKNSSTLFEAHKEQLYKSIYPLFFLTQALLQQKIGEIRLLYIYNEHDDEINPFDAAISGYIRTLKMENPDFFFKTVALNILANQQIDTHNDLLETIEIILYELTVNAEDIEIRLKGNIRYTKHLRLIPLQANSKKNQLWKERGTYLITGGMGSLGMIIAQYLAEKFKARLILAGRSALTPEKKSKLNELKSLGAEVIYHQSDIENYEETKLLAKKIKQHFNILNGILHCAGVIQDAFILKKNHQQFKEVLAAKVIGTLNLDEVFKKNKIDFFMFFSSLSAILGNVGQCDYAYANRFMDYYAQYRETLTHNNMRFGKAISINWPYWNEGGMKVSGLDWESASSKFGFKNLTTAKGIEALEYITNYLPHLSNCQAFYGNREQIIKKVIPSPSHEKQVEMPTVSSHHLTLKKIDTEVLFKKTEEYLKNLMAEILKLPVHQFDSTVKFEKYGIDSIIIKKFNTRIEKELFSIKKTLLFEYQKLEDVTQYFVKNHTHQLAQFFHSEKESLSLEKHEEGIIKPDKKGWRPLIPLLEKYPEIQKKNSNNINTSTHNVGDIAIIGISGRYPQSRNINEFWENLKKGRNCIKEIPINRWDNSIFFDPDPDKGMIYTKWGGFLEDVEYFDPLLFNLSPREAKTMDPQERLFLETVWELLEDAGYNREALNRNVQDLDKPGVGVFVGITSYLYHLLGKGLNQVQSLPQPWSLANRVSYIFNFHGPSMPLDTACSSSLTAIHLACESLRRGESHLAIAGGVNLYLHPAKYLGMCRMRMLSATGRCHTFSANSDGFIPGEGVGSVLLKPLAEALQDNDQIYALIKGSSINHGGRTNGYTVPNPAAQASLIVNAIKNSNINPRTLGYIEAHGTGTILGDPIEIEGLTQAFRKFTQEKQFCPIGSVKSNIGHLESAAGIAGITKIILQLKNRQLVPSLLSESLNPNIDFKDTPFYVQRELSEWNSPVKTKEVEERNYPLRAGISSFGAGGTNVHIILEEFEKKPEVNDIYSHVPAISPEIYSHAKKHQPISNTSNLILLSARNNERLKEYARILVNFLGVSQQVKTYAATKSYEEIQSDLLIMVADILKVNQNDIDSSEDLISIGIDTISWADFIERINQRYNINFTSNLISGSSSINSLVSNISNENRKKALKYSTSNQLESDFRLVDIAYTLQLGREPMEERLAIICSNLDELKDKLSAFIRKPSINNLKYVYTGNTKSGKSIPLSLFKGKAGDEHLRILLKDRELTQLAHLWVLGIEIDWLQLYKRTAPNRISLPTYPFARERCWLDDSYTNKHEQQIFLQKSNSPQPLHPLIDSIQPNLSLGLGLVFQKKFLVSETIIKEHKVRGNPLLPGVGYLEMAHAAFTYASKENHFQLSRVLLLQPLVMQGKEKNVKIIIKSNNQKNHEFQIQGNDKTGDKSIIHARGEFSLQSGPQMPQKNIQQYNLQETKSRFNRLIEKKQIYDWYNKVGVNYGPYFQTVQRIYISDSSKEALGELNLSPSNQKELNSYTLHPALMDGALQVIIGSLISPSNQQPSDLEPHLPYAIEKVEIFKPVKKSAYAYIKPSNRSKSGIGEMKIFDVEILDESGLVCIKFHEITFRPLKKSLPAQSVLPNLNDMNLENFSFRPIWIKMPSNDHEKERSQITGKSKIVIFFNHSSEKLKIALTHQLQNQEDEVISIELGTTTYFENKENWQVDVRNPLAIKQAISKLNDINCIYFLGGITTPVTYINQLEPLKNIEESQQVGVLSLFRLIKALIDHSIDQKKIKLKVITNDVHALNPGETLNPNAGSLHGLTLSAAKENSQWEVVCLDITLKKAGEDKKETWDQINEIASAIIHEPGIESGQLVMLRAGQRYIRRLEPIKLAPINQMPFKPKGVYLILGGTGGIGLELAGYLSKVVKSRLILIDRNPLKKPQIEKITQIESQGGEVLFLRADACQMDELKSAVDKAIKHFGSIDGVIHSAIVLKDKSLAQMDEETFYAVLAPKTIGSINLFQVVREQPLQFFLFFSAAQSFVCNAGQSNYAAGCTFKDAFASYINQKTSYPVKIINWGYWGTVGIVATQFYQHRLANQGIYPITPQEGMEAIKRLLCHPICCLVPLKAEGFIMKNLLTDNGYQVEIYPTQMPSIFFSALETLRLSFREDQRAQMEAGYKYLNRYSQLLLINAFQQMGVFRESNKHYEIDSLAQKIGIIPTYMQLYKNIIDILIEAGILKWKETKHKIETTEFIDTPEMNNISKTFEKIKKEILKQDGDLSSHLNLLETCLAKYPALLKGETTAHEVMFPNSSAELVEGIYKGNIRADYFNLLTAQCAYAYVRERYKHLKPGEKITICEIGAGTGGTSKFVLEQLHDYHHCLSYVYTDISMALINSGKKYFSENNPFMKFTRLDVETDIRSQEYPTANTDLIIASNVVHATRDIKKTLRNIKQMLKKHGWLILNEVTGKHDFATLTFGLTTGWWLFEDEEERIPGSPLLDEKMWKKCLKQEGYTQVKSFGDKSTNTSGFIPTNHVIIAESNGEVKKPRENIKKSIKGQKKIIPGTSSTLVSFPPKQTQNIVPDIKQKVNQTIMESLAKVLQINGQEFDKETPFMDFGVDSILAVEIINLVNNSLKIQLRTTDLFNFPNISSLSHHILTQLISSIPHPSSQSKFFSQPESIGSDQLTALKNEEEKIDTNKMITQESIDDPLITILQRMKNGDLDIYEANDLLEVYDEV